MKVEQLDNTPADLVDPSSGIWGDQAADTIPLRPVPLAAQPTEYIRASRADRPYGETAEVAATALRCGDKLYVRLEWQDDERTNGEFADAAAVILGSGDGIVTLGRDDAPITLWYWAADREDAQSLSSAGPGVVRKNNGTSINAASKLNNNRWSVVLSGPAAEVNSSQLGVAIWNGSNDERAGLAAISDWLPLEMG